MNRWAVIGLAAYAAFTAIAISAGIGREIGVADGRKSEKAEQARLALARIEAVKPVQAELDRRIKAHFETLNGRAAAMREVRHETETILERPVYRNVCVDADGVRLLDRAADIANGRADLAGLVGRTGGTAEAATPAGRHDGRGAVPDQP